MDILLHTETTIDSAHFLKGYKGKCSNLHGHTWSLHIWIKGDSSQLDEVGILFDFGKIGKIKEKFDHKLINEVPPFDKTTPTAENLSKWIYEELKFENSNLFFKIRLYETKIGKETYCEVGDKI